jgi:hypothetical protein
MIRRTTFVLAAAVVLVAGLQLVGGAETAPQGEQKWTGELSDSMCGRSHGANGGTMAKNHDCAIGCVKGGSTHVFVVGDKIFKIADQKMPDLERHAGHRVEITGTMKGDTITVSKVTMLRVK